ncbi:MAG: tRNA (adenosine(37)-N6)-dimethylallyltransferase MiaA [Bacteroidales bacterium]
MSDYSEYDLICVLGPTASGKTKFAVHLASELNTEIISADSRQVYRGMDIGTGKDISEYTIPDGNGGFKQIPYHLIDIIDAGEKYDIYHYRKDFLEIYTKLRNLGQCPILCGGSGLYIEAAIRDYDLQAVPPDPQLRAKLEEEPTDRLIAKLASLKPLHNGTDYDTRKRLIRALEIAIYQSEHPQDPSQELTSAGEKIIHPRNVKYIGINVSREERIARIDARLDARLKEGLVEEVEGLIKSGIPPENLIYYGLEYKFVTKYILGELSFEQMREKLAIAIHQFSKRQMTWFRGMSRRGIEIEWVDPFKK